MIRFDCPHCGRNYELPDALARLPLVCKKCGQRITPPDPPPPPPPKPRVKPAAAPAPPPAAPPLPDAPRLPPPAPPKPAAPAPNVAGPTAAGVSEGTIARPAEPRVNVDLLPKPAARKQQEQAEPAADKAEPTLLPFLADLVALVLLVVLGLFLGELVTRKSTGEILSEAGSAPKFPPVDLLLWAAPAIMFGLVYLLLSRRDLTLGAWIRRRRQSET